tara:strand:- start:748 stop:1053 length:306 start_codon:yes stop_codon:yes gene_type:complete
MKLTRTYLKQLIKEEMQQLQEMEQTGTSPLGTEEEEEDPKVQALRQKLVAISRSTAGIASNETGIVNLLANLIELAKEKNMNVAEFKRRLELVKAAAEKIQ